MTEGGDYPREKAERFIAETGKKLKDDTLKVRPAHKACFFPIESTVEPGAELMVRLDPDGDFALQAMAPGKTIICRWDRSPHWRSRKCEETEEEILDGHKHYMADNVEGKERVVKRGEDHIPTASLPEAVKAFCAELNIHPPHRVVSTHGTALKETP